MNQPIEIVERARRYIRTIPGAIMGQGGHNATFHVAGVLVQGFALGFDDALRLLQEWNLKCVPPWSADELVHKIRSAMSSSPRKPLGYLIAGSEACEPFPILTQAAVSPPKPRRDPLEVLHEYLGEFRCTEGDLATASPVRLPADWRLGGALLIEHLFANHEFVNLVTNYAPLERADGVTKARPTGIGVALPRDRAASRCKSADGLGGDAGAWIRMNPTDGQGVNDSNITAHRFALIESDSLPIDLQLALLSRLPLPIAAIITSGGVSLHAWILMDSSDSAAYERDVSALFASLVDYGIDCKNRNPSRLSRLPGARRVIGARGDGLQKLLYLNPQPEQGRIIQ